jgi:hypothetical protein
MKLTCGRKLGFSFVLLACSILLLRVNGWFGVGIPIGLVLSILYWFDYGRELRARPPKSRALRIVGFLMGVPQALFGLLCMAAGIAIIVWVLYNSLWRHDSAYTGGFLTFGIGPLAALFGFGFLADAFRVPPKRLDESMAVEFDYDEVRVTVLDGEIDARWNQRFAWRDIARVCFRDAGLYASDVLSVTVRGREKLVIVPMEAKGASQLVGALAEKGYFPEHIWRRAFGDTGGGTHCWPP